MAFPRAKKRSKKIEATPMDEDEKKKNRERKHVLRHISRAPGKCALCNQLVFPSSMLLHMIRKHNNSPNTDLAIIYDDQGLRKNFNLNRLKYDKPQALNILLYAGTEGKPQTRPARRFLSFSNYDLPLILRQYEHHLMMILMICKTSCSSMLPRRNSMLKKMRNTPENTIYVIWVIGPETTSRMFYTLTAFDRSYTQSRSVIRKTRNFFLSQRPKDFLYNENDYLMLRHEEAMGLMRGEGDEVYQTPYIKLELFVHVEPSLVSLPTQLLPKPMMSDKVRKFPLSNKAVDVPLPRMMTEQQLERVTRMSREGVKADTKAAEESNVISDDEDSDVKKGLLIYMYSVTIPEDQGTQKQVKDVEQANPLETGPVVTAPYPQDEFEKHAADQGEDKCRQLLKSMEGCPEASSNEIKNVLKDVAKERSLGDKDSNQQSINERNEFVNDQNKHNESSEMQSGSHEKAELSQEGSQKSSEIFNLVKPINNRVEQTIKDEVFDWIKDTVRKVAEETITTKLHIDSELELQPELETKTGNKAAKPTN
ncbi:uncharacterized protein LOC6612459 [Drosophila sechellia]|uniref:GM12369 n=1 Tax=Drosophila sechellia TaxID=7238 RepID=B4I0U5_DROSE|nr:uncharacterized protein LOC6612459 [Drosophila sechellia]EDW53126.1 GM12369 [Drosophila sechellia]